MDNKPLKHIRLLDPSMCADCRFCEYKLLEVLKGGVRMKLQTIVCKRLDCDNHVHEDPTNEPIEIIQDLT